MRKTLIMLVVVTTVINAIYWLSRNAGHSHPAYPDSANTQPQNSQTQAATAAETSVELMDIPIRISADGNLISDTHLKQLFDLIAANNTEEPVDQWKHQILQPFADQLPPQALAQLQDAFDRYVEFNLALQLLPMEGAPNLAAVLQRVQPLREHYLGDYAAGMYADWNALEQFTWQYLDIMGQHRDVKVAQRKLEALAEQLPASVQQRARNMINTSAEDFAVDDMASLEPEAYTRMLQEQAAVALIETTLLFDEPSPEFMAQFQRYSDQKRDLLLSDASETDQQQQLEALRQQYFKGSDILRVETLDRAEAF